MVIPYVTPNPSWRRSVKDALQALADQPLMHRATTGLEGRDGDWLFDYATEALPADPAQYVGELFRDQEEAAAVEAVLVALSRVRESVPCLAYDEEYVSSPIWPEVAASAAIAFGQLEAADDPPAPPSRADLLAVLDSLVAERTQAAWIGADRWASQWVVYGRRDVPGDVWYVLTQLCDSSWRDSDKDLRERALKMRDRFRHGS